MARISLAICVISFNAVVATSFLFSSEVSDINDVSGKAKSPSDEFCYSKSEDSMAK